MATNYLVSPALSPYLQGQVEAQQYLTSVGKMIDAGTVPSGWIEVTPGTWAADSVGVFVQRTEHLPVLLTSERCGTCGLRHLDKAIEYMFRSYDELPKPQAAKEATP